MTLLFACLAGSFGLCLAAIWSLVTKRPMTFRRAAIPVLVSSIVGGGFVLLVPVAPAPAATAERREPKAAVDLLALNTALSTRPKQPSWSAVEFAPTGTSHTYRVYLTYGDPPHSMAQIEADTIAVARMALDVLAENGVDPWQGDTFVSVYARRPSGAAGGRALERRYGNATFSAITGRFDFKPAD